METALYQELSVANNIVDNTRYLFRYYGQTENNMRNGIGKTMWHDLNETYIGYWRNNKLNSKGVYKWSNGDVYYRDWQNGLMHGLGNTVCNI